MAVQLNPVVRRVTAERSFTPHATTWRPQQSRPPAALLAGPKEQPRLAVGVTDDSQLNAERYEDPLLPRGAMVSGRRQNAPLSTQNYAGARFSGDRGGSVTGMDQYDAMRCDAVQPYAMPSTCLAATAPPRATRASTAPTPPFPLAPARQSTRAHPARPYSPARSSRAHRSTPGAT